jgi:hypothetical protein
MQKQENNTEWEHFFIPKDELVKTTEVWLDGKCIYHSDPEEMKNHIERNKKIDSGEIVLRW